MSQLRMEKDDLEKVPAIPVPDGYTVRHYRQGDEVGLARVYPAAALGNETVEAIRANILNHPCFSPERLFVAECQGEIVGTAAAWISPDDPTAGYLHMVGVLPAHQGKRLGAVLIIATIHYTRNEGLRCQRLDTDDWRDAALRLYLDLGYRPVYTDDTHAERWAALAQRLGRPDILANAKDAREP